MNADILTKLSGQIAEQRDSAMFKLAHSHAEIEKLMKSLNNAKGALTQLKENLNQKEKRFDSFIKDLKSWQESLDKDQSNTLGRIISTYVLNNEVDRLSEVEGGECAQKV